MAMPPPPGEGVRYHGGIGAAVPFEMSTKLGAITNLFSGLGRSSTATGGGFGQRDDASYDRFLEQLAEDTKQYVKEIFFTLEKTVPKAIVHTQVRPLNAATTTRCWPSLCNAFSCW